MPDSTLKTRRLMTEYCHRLYARDLVGSTQGNVSVRYDDNTIFITPTGSNLGFINVSDFVTISSTGEKIKGRGEPSSEYDVHVKIYAGRKDVNAVCHAHPIAATALSLVDFDLSRLILPEIIHEFGIIPVVEYGTPGTAELYESLERYVVTGDGFILRNHGAITLGRTLEQAFNKMEMLERYARTLNNAIKIGTIREIPVERARKIPGYDRIEKLAENYRIER